MAVTMGSRKFDEGNVDNFEREVNYVQLSSSLSSCNPKEDYIEQGSSSVTDVGTWRYAVPFQMVRERVSTKSPRIKQSTIVL